jgi:hypothetical protein
MENGVGSLCAFIHTIQRAAVCDRSTDPHRGGVWIQQKERTVGPAVISGFCSVSSAERKYCTVESCDRFTCNSFKSLCTNSYHSPKRRRRAACMCVSGTTLHVEIDCRQGEKTRF